MDEREIPDEDEDDEAIEQILARFQFNKKQERRIDFGKLLGVFPE